MPLQCICYDITNYSTFESIQRWVKKLQQEADKNCFIVLVGNKYDLVEQDPSLRKVDKAEVKRYAQTIDAEVFEASAKSGMNVADIFSHVRFSCTLFGAVLHFHCFNRWYFSFALRPRGIERSQVVSGYVDRVQGKFPEEVAGKFKLGGAAPAAGGNNKGAAAGGGAADPNAGGCSC